MSSDQKDLSQLLKAWSTGDESALNRLTPIIYDELRRLARGYMRRERPGNTLQTTALVHETYIRLVDVRDADFKGRLQFFALSAQIMRRILVDCARSRAALKRGGLNERIDRSEAVNFDDIRLRETNDVVELLALDEALNDLARIDPRKARVIELRFFGEMSVEQTAESLNISPQTVMRDWKLARAWLMRRMTGRGPVWQGRSTWS